MKILQVNKFYFPWVGGVEKVVQQIAEGLNGKNNFEIEILCCQSKGKGSEEMINNVKVYRASSFGVYLGMPISFDFFKKYKKLIDNYNLVFLHYPFPLAFIAYLLFSRNKDLVIWYHSDIVRQKIAEIFFRPFHWFAFKKAKKIFVSNPNLIKSSVYLRKFEQKCVVIPFGVDLEKFKLTEKIKSEAGLIQEKYGKPIILSIGRYVYYKGFEYLIEAAKDIDAKFLIIGSGPLKNKYEKLIKKYNLENKVFLIPPLENLSSFYYACDVFVLPSIAKSEAFGLVLIEAMACGKPVISTELGTGTSFVNQDGVTGFVVPPKNSQALAQAIKKIIENKNILEEFGKNAQERVRTNFSLEKMLEEVEKNLKAF